MRWMLPGGLILLCNLPAVAQSSASADSLLARGDTNGAIEMFEHLVRDDWRNAEARWRVGVLYMSRHVPGSLLSPNRRRAEEHFRYATRMQPDSSKYWLALAGLFRGEDWGMTRAQVDGLVDHALEAAERGDDPVQLVEASWRAARVEFERWEHYGNRWEITGTEFRVDPVLFHREWEYLEEFFTTRARPLPGVSGEGPYANAERLLRRAHHLAPEHTAAAGLLIVLLGARERWEEALEVARLTRRAAPTSAAAWAQLGLAFARANRWVEAGAAYDSAFGYMTEQERAPYRNLGRLFRAADRERWSQMPASEQRALDSLYWTLAQPLLVTDRDEPHTEFHARITYARIRWNDPDLGRDGLDTHRGLVYVRYGPPETVAVFNRSEIHWIYWRSRLRFQFRLAPGFANARLGDESQEAFDIASRSLPARFDNIPAVRNLDTIATQVAQFRGENDRTDVAVFGWVPVDRMIAGTDLGDLALNTALILMNDGGEVGRTPRAESVSPDRAASGEHRSWRVTLPAGEFLMRLEAHAPTIDAGARHSSIVNVRSYRAPALAASDLLLARRLAPRDTNSTRWTEFFIEPSAGRIAPGEPVSLLWELYNLTPDASGIARWHVELRVTVAAVERRTWAAQLLGGIGDAIGSSAVGDDRITLSWDREAVQASRGARAEWVTLDFGAAPAGTYTITIVATDLVSRQTVETSRVLERTSLTVGENP